MGKINSLGESAFDLELNAPKLNSVLKQSLGQDEVKIIHAPILRSWEKFLLLIIYRPDL